MRGFKVLPLNKKQLDNIAKGIRKLAKKFINQKYLDIVKFLEYLNVNEIVEMEIIDDKTWNNNSGYEDIEAYLCPNDHIIKIKESIYVKATNKDFRSRFTLAHELGHFLLHKNQPVMTRKKNISNHKTWEDSEWQADYFAGSLLAPTSEVIQIDNVVEISHTFGISQSAAKIRINQSIKKIG